MVVIHRPNMRASAGQRGGIAIGIQTAVGPVLPARAGVRGNGAVRSAAVAVAVRRGQ